MERLSNGHKFIGVDPLELIKFICKEFWEEIFKKKVGLQEPILEHRAFCFCSI